MKTIRLSLFQEKLWLDDVLKAPTSEYNEINFAFRVSGNLSISRLREAYRNIMLEYLPLSSTIQVSDNVPSFVHETDDFEVPFFVMDEKDVAEYGSVDAAIDTLAKLPFDLGAEFPCRFYCIKSGAEYCLFHLVHHVALDGNTAQPFFDRLSEIYHQLKCGNYVPFPQTESIEAYNRELEYVLKERKHDNVEYWKHYLADVPTCVAIPQNGNDDQGDGLSYSYPFSIEPALESQLKDLCKRKKTTLFRVYSSVWALTLSRMLGIDELLLVHSIAMLPEDRRLFGTYINNLPIKFIFGDNETFTDLLNYSNENRVHEKCHAHIHHSDFLPQSKQGEKQRSLNLGINYPLSLNSMRLELDDCEVRLWKHVYMELSTDLMLSVETDGVVSCEIRHNPRLDTNFVRSVADTFRYVLVQVAECPEIRLDSIRLVTAERQVELETIENGYLHDIDEPKTFLASFKERVADNPKQVAIVNDARSVTYSELDRQSDALALFLISRGVMHRRVGLSIPKGIDTIVGMLGILKSCNSYVPIDHTNPLSRIRHIANDCDLSLILVNQESESCFDGMECINISNLAASDIRMPEALPTVGLLDEAYIIYTSGTTGQSKGIPVSHGMLAHTVSNNISLLNLGSDTRIMQFINVVFDASVVEIFPTLAAGGTLFLPLDEERKDSELLLSFLRRNDITLATLPAVMLSSLPQVELPSLATIIIGGDTTTQETMKFWSKDRRMINVYGPSENTVDTTYNVIAPCSQINDIGTNMPGVTCYVLDKDMRMLPDYAIGELYIGGVKLTRGYLNRQELNERKFLPNPYVSEQDRTAGKNCVLYKSGDLVMRRSDGHILFLGRSDFQVKINGFRIELGEVENRIKTYGHGVNDVVVVVHGDNEAKTLVAYVLTADAATFDSKGLTAFLHDNLPSYMIPALIVPLQSFPYNTSGKVDRSKLPCPSTVKNMEDYKLPVTLTEKMLAKLWSNLTNADFIGRDDNFTSLGGDSIAVIKLVYDIHRVFGINIRATDIYKNATLSELATFLDTVANDNDTAVEEQLLRVACEVMNVDNLTLDSDLFAEGLSSDQLNAFVGKAASEHNVFFTTYDVREAKDIRKLVKSIDRNLYFWSEGTFTGKPVILFINGFVDYYPYNEPLNTVLEKHFSVFNLESFCTHFIGKDNVSLDELFKVYDDIVTVALKGKEIFAVTGYCIGAELSIAFASYMQKRHQGLNLQVLNIEGIYDRTLYKELGLDFSYSNSSERMDIFNRLYATMPPLNYSGPVINVMVSQPMDLIPIEATDEATFKKKLYRAWRENIENWKRHYPECPLYFVNCSHMYFREEKNLRSFMKILKKCWRDKLNVFGAKK
ncbi:MAG: amino acid adenylation domain-containing protein [Prevotella sp.]